MIEIRVICDNTDRNRVTAALLKSFTLSNIRSFYSNDGKRLRLYATADPRPVEAQWPTPEEAYANAPSLDDESEQIVRLLDAAEAYTERAREYDLRRAALFDRITLLPNQSPLAAEDAEAAAYLLLDADKSSDGDYRGGPYSPEHHAAEGNPRGYVRQEYAHWHAQQRRTTDPSHS
ncbi:hypothetical protein [Streptomyces sp. YGL11-2]|uniref:hypothetical protein n=1 Tax=Streptomyces sp. YGL11-2 TaxID=3414028 RepID=UPI003CF32436